MIADTSRGNGWTNAVLGLLAKEIHLCGEERSAELIWRLVQLTGDEIEFREYKRRTPLVVLDKPYDMKNDLQEGDCVIAFSAKEVMRIREVSIV
jgi:ATP-dependent RNA helicase SUPV3L1/SUV3